jgi:hypothetical protein
MENQAMTTKQKPTAPAVHINPELRRYCEKRQAIKEAEWKKAVAEGRVHELVKYDPKTGRCVWRKVKA